MKTVDSNAYVESETIVDDLIYKAEIETDIENRCMDTTGRRGTI